MKNKVIISLILGIVVLISYFNIVNAASTTVTASEITVNSGEEITITLTSTVSLAGYTVSVDSSDGCTFKSVSAPSGVNGNKNGSTIGGVSNDGTKTLATYKFTAPSVTEDKKYSIKFSITGILGADDEELDNTSATAAVTVKAQTTSNPGTTTPSNPAPKSTEAKLSNLGITPNDFKGFKKDTYSYTHEVPYSVSEVTVYAEPVKGATVTSGTEKFALKEGNNTIEVVVKAEAGNTQKYTLTIKRRTAAEEAALSGEASDATLKSLGIKPEEYDFSGFQKDKTEYSVEVPEDVEEIEVYAEASSSKAQVSGTGKVKLKNGENKLIVQVTAEDGTTKTYTIEVTRDGTEATATNDEDGGFGLSSLEIKDLTLNPSFKTGTYEYTIELSEDLSALDIEAIATDEDATIEIVGNENLQQGENVITILVTNEETDETAIYQILVNKNVTVAEEKMSWLKPSTWGREEIIKIAIIAVLIILIIIAIILKIKIAKEKKSDEDIDLPGGEELDKALAEHQELEETAEFEKIEMPEERNKPEEMTELGRAETSNGVDQLEENETSKGISDLDGTNYIEDIAKSKNYKIDYQDDDFNNSGSKRKGKHF